MINTSKPFVNVGFMEFTYDIERKRFADMLSKKASHIKHLDSIEYFDKSDMDIQTLLQRIEWLRSELNVLYGFLLVTDKMKESYECTLEKIRDCYQATQVNLEKQIEVQAHEINFLRYLVSVGIESDLFLCDLVLKEKSNNEKD